MSDGTVKVTAEAHLHISQLMNLLQGPLNDVLSQVSSHGLALTDPNIWAGPAASLFSNNVWPVAQGQLDQVRGTLTDLQQQVAGILSSITQAGSGGLPVVGSLPVVGGLVGGLTSGL
ncbi:MAG: hypothetical protein HOV87_26830 [Catenulispora sp.]|nr:hypothetical protein [Catenulispora sp.]